MNNKVRFHVSWSDMGWPIVLIRRDGKTIDTGPEIKSHDDIADEMERVGKKFSSSDRDFSIPRLEQQVVIYLRKARPKKTQPKKREDYGDVQT